MYRKIILLLAAFNVNAHEMVPTYPKFERAHLEGIYKTQVTLFNKRKDVEFYELGVFDSDFGVVDFVTAYRIFPVRYLGYVNLDIYVKESDRKKVTYICTRSKLRSDSNQGAIVASRICSKVKP